MTAALIIAALIAIEAFCIIGLVGQWCRGRGPRRQPPRPDYGQIAVLEHQTRVGRGDE